MVLNVLNLDTPMIELNKTNITLVPKVGHPTRMKDFCPLASVMLPISLYPKFLPTILKLFCHN